MFRKWLAIALLSGFTLAATAALPMLNHFKFDTKIWLTPYPRTASDRVMLAPEMAHDGQGALKIMHSGVKTSAYSGVRFNAAPGELEVAFNRKVVKTSGNPDFQLKLNFNRANGGNGSAGTITLPVTGTPEWQRQVFRVAVPEAAASVQFIFEVSGAPKEIYIHDLYFGYAADQIRVPLVKKADLNAPLTHALWNPKAPVAAFYRQGEKVAQETECRIAADDAGLYLAFINQGAVTKAQHAPDQRDAALWTDDCNELFLFNPATHKGWQFIVNANGAVFDGILYQKQDGDPWQCDASWNGDFTVRTAKRADGWESRMFIPWQTLGLKWERGLELGMNMARENKGTGEDSSWNFTRRFNDPTKFAALKISDGKLSLQRYRKLTPIVYTIKRAKPQFASLLVKGEPGNYLLGAWAQGYYKGDFPKAMVEKHGDAEFTRWQRDMLRAWGQAKMFGPAFPWLPNHLPGGAADVEALHAASGMKFPYSIHSSAICRIARERGAKFMLPRDSKAVSPVDPVAIEVLSESIRAIPASRHYPMMKDKIAFIMGVDEPCNGYTETFSRTLNKPAQAALDQLDVRIKKDYGFGQYGLMDEFGDDDPKIEFKRIAFLRWLNDAFKQANIQWRHEVKAVFPGVPFKMATNNTCGGLAPLDYSNLNDCADMLACDPYPTSTTYNFGIARALYHTGFSTKILRDLAPKAMTLVMPQGFAYCGGRPGNTELREWAAQALKNGAQGLMWYCQNAPFEIFEEYKTMLALNKFLSTMDKLKLPEKTQTAILFSTYDQYALRDNIANAAYSIYAILGEGVKSNFRFISNSGLANGTAKLDDYKLIYIPKLTYTDKALTAKLLQFVEKGGTLVVFDPRFLSFNIDGSPVAEREKLTGVKKLTLRTKDAAINWNGKNLALAKNQQLKIPGGMDVESYDPDNSDGKIIATYADGKPAAIERSAGKGKVIFFAAQPFGNAELVQNPGAWLDFFQMQADAVGEKTGLPIWDFTLPEDIVPIPLEKFGSR